MSQMPNKIWLHKDTKYSTGDVVCGYQYDFVQGIEDEGGIENFVKYVPADAFVDKACEWLKNNAYFYVNDLTGSLDEISLIEDFKKALEE
jgi:hypothetical protein